MNSLFIEIAELLVNIFESFITVEFVTKINETKYKGRKKYIAAGIVFLLLTINAEIFNYITYFSEAMTYMGLTIIFLYSLIFLKGKISRRFFSCITILFMIAVINLLTTLTFSIIFDVKVKALMSEFTVYRFSCLMVSKIILFASTRILLNFSVKGISNIGTSTFILVTAVPLLTIVVIVIITEVSFNLMPNDMDTLYLFLSLLGMIAINIIFYALLARLDKEYSLQTENRLLKQKSSLQLEYIKKTHALNEEIRTIRHDMKNQIIYLKQIFLERRYEEGLSYANHMIEKIDSKQKLINTGRLAFDAIVNAKLRESADKGITVCYNITCSLDNRIEDDDMVSILGNIFDNAIEACEHIHGRKEIYMEVKKVHSYLLIMVKNTINSTVLENNPELKSTKQDKISHGIGIKNVKKIAKKYDGFITHEERYDEFICKIMLLA